MTGFSPGGANRPGGRVAMVALALWTTALSAGAETQTGKEPSTDAAAPKDDSSVKVGVTIFADYTYQDAPTITDSDQNGVHLSTFEVRRAYVNVTGAISESISYRVTPDIAARFSETVTVQGPPGTVPPAVGVTTSLDGSAVVRLKYAFGQFDLGRLLKSKGSWIRLGQQQTPYVDFMEGVYRYRFQGTIFVEREAFLSSADVGLSARYVLPNGYGDVHAGFYNGDTYAKAEANDQKALQIRASLRPLPKHAVLKGLRIHAFYDHDSPVRRGARTRFVGTLTFEHKRVNLGFDRLDAEDRGRAQSPEVQAKGWSLWVTPRTTFGLEGFFRHDEVKPSRTVDAKKRRTIVGAGYWFRDRMPLSTAILADFEQVEYDALLAKPTERRYEVKACFTF